MTAISPLSHNPRGCTKTPSSGNEVVTAPPINFGRAPRRRRAAADYPQKLPSPRKTPPRAQLINSARKRDAEENDPKLVSKSKQFGATASR